MESKATSKISPSLMEVRFEISCVIAWALSYSLLNALFGRPSRLVGSIGFMSFFVLVSELCPIGSMSLVLFKIQTIIICLMSGQIDVADLF
jgi:hypothetical protein